MSQVSDVTNELKQTDNMVLQLKSDPLTEINNFIQQESLLMPYTETQDIYGTVDEYLEIVLLISFLMLFGMLFPLSYTLGFIWCSSEIQSDKFKIMKWIQRPIPVFQSNIGQWNTVIQFGIYVSIISNSAIITYISQVNKTI